MRHKYRLSHEAVLDVEEGYLWYERKQKGLGERFLDSLDKAEQLITENPLLYRVRYLNRVRGFVVKDFPYLVLYVLNDEYIDVISVFKTYQDPAI